MYLCWLFHWTFLISLSSGQFSKSQLLGNSFGVPGQDATFDYVVVGGGTAGLAIARRLAADPNISVAVVEAGGFYELDNGNGSVVPAFAPLQHVGTLPNDTQPLIDWGFVTVPQAGANGRRMHYARGKTLGGSSALNFLAYHRQVPPKSKGGSVGSYQQWADQVGDNSYLFDSFLPYFQRSASLTAPNLEKRYSTNSTVEFNATSFNSSIGGPLQVSWPNWAIPIGSWAQIALATAGIPPINGFNSGRLMGSTWITETLNPMNQHRSSSQTSYLNEAINTTSIVVYIHTLATRILFDANNTAAGVSVQTAGLPYTLHTRREVILSAGVFQSPQLLMLSGIGPRRILENQDIPVLADLPGVGQNLWDQVYYGVSFRVNVETSSRLSDPVYAAQASENYNSNQAGPLTDTGTFIGFEKLPASYRQHLSASARERLSSAFSDDWPEIEYLVQGAFNGYNTNYTAVDPNDGYQYATISSALVAPLSRGNVTLSSSDPTHPPIINPNWLTDPTDIELAVLAFKRVREIWGYMNGTTIGEEYFPGTAEVATDEEILDFIRHSLVQVWHAAGTCKMGRREDPMAVLDAKGKVYKVQGLRVVDASAFPLLPPGHPQATVYALAEKIADDIVRGN